MVDYTPSKGDFIRLRFAPQVGHELMGTRPASVVSHTKFNQKRGFVFVCPISNTKRKNPFYINIPLGSVAVTGVIMADQLRSLDYRARVRNLLVNVQMCCLLQALMRIKPIIF